MSTKTLIIYTGGTFGMRRTSAGYTADSGLAALLKQALSAVPTELPDYRLLELDRLMDSANMAPADWHRIAGIILDHYEAYDGFVVLHGTDTMAYTASALSFILQGLDKPVIITGSQIPLRELRSDAYGNLVASLVMVEQFRIPEVCLYFNGKLLRGNRTTKVSAGSLDAFASPNYPLLGEVGIDIHINEKALLPAVAGRDFRIPVNSDVELILVKLFPGMPLGYLERLLDLSPHGMVLETYGTGNAPTSDQGFLRFLMEASRRNIALVAVSQCAHSCVDFGKYAVGSALADAGVVSGLDMTAEAAFTKLHHLLGRGLTLAEVRRQMPVALCGELTQPGGER